MSPSKINLQKTTLIVVLSFIFMTTTFSQLEWGMKVGISSYDLGTKNIKQWSQDGSFTKQFTEADFGHHFGLYGRAKIGFIYLEPAVLFQSGSFTYTFEDYSEAGVITTVRKERYNHVNMPLMLGVKAGFFRIHAGPVGHLFINRTSDLIDPETYDGVNENFAFSLQGGLGLDIWKFRFDVNYEANVKSLGNEISIGKESFKVNQTPPRLVFTVGFKF